MTQSIPQLPEQISQLMDLADLYANAVAANVDDDAPNMLELEQEEEAARSDLAEALEAALSQPMGVPPGMALNKDEIQALLDILKLDHDGSDFEAECPNCTAYQKLTAMLEGCCGQDSGESERQGDLSLKSQPPAGQQDIGWQPIETAPKGANGYAFMQLSWGPDEDKCAGDGMRHGDDFYATAVFHAPGQERRYQFRELKVSPTHWRPAIGPSTKGVDHG